MYPPSIRFKIQFLNIKANYKSTTELNDKSLFFFMIYLIPWLVF